MVPYLGEPAPDLLGPKDSRARPVTCTCTWVAQDLGAVGAGARSTQVNAFLSLLFRTRDQL